VGVEAAGEGLDSGRHAATLARGEPGILHGAHTVVLQDGAGQVVETHSIAAGLDYPAVGPEHASLRARGRASYVARTDAEALAAFEALARDEGIIPALESAHALAEALGIAHGSPRPLRILVNLSGRGDKDLETVAALRGLGSGRGEFPRHAEPAR
jgi:tryptophan synthase beta chain